VAPRVSVSQITTLRSSFAEDLRDYADAGLAGIGIWELKLGDGPDGVGRVAGRHLLAPRLSPKKTWEGFLAGAIAGIFATFVALSCSDYSLTGPTAPAQAQAGLLDGLLGTVTGLLGSVIRIIGFVTNPNGIPVTAVQWAPTHINQVRTVSATIGANGGSLAIPGSDFAIFFPEGALSAPTGGFAFHHPGRRAGRGRGHPRHAVIPAPFEYVRVDSPDEAVAALAEHGEEAKLLAGGHSLLPLMKLRLATPSVVIDVGRLRELAYIREEHGEVAIGALTRHRDLESSPLLAARVPVLAHVAGLVGDPQVRHRGTIGGSLARSAAWRPGLLAARHHRGVRAA